MRILVIEDERKIASFLRRGLEEEGHRVLVAEDLAAARRTVAVEELDLLLVDRMLPDGDGLSLVRELRREGNKVPVICLTARDRTEEKVAGLYGGADDYMVKPFSFEELLARIAAVTRRGGAEERLRVGDLEMDLAGHRAFRAGQELPLTPREFVLLRTLAESRGRVLSRTRLLERVWETNHDPGTNVVDVAVSALRAKLDHPFDRPLLHTVRGVGYVLDETR